MAEKSPMEVGAEKSFLKGLFDFVILSNCRVNSNKGGVLIMNLKVNICIK